MNSKKIYKPILLSLLLAGSLVAMIQLKSLWESSKVLNEDVTILRVFFRVSLTVFISTLGYIIFSWFFARWREYKLLKNERVEAELQLLKSKIDPHFFFNTLNNLYGLAREKSDATPEVILELSDIMRYVIYDGEKERVTITEEVEYLQKYLKLHSLRYQDNTRLELTTKLDDNKIEVAPLLLVILIENAVKHGLEKVSESPYLIANLTTNNGHLVFEVKNAYSCAELPYNGLGLKTLERRLELIYPKRHKFSTERIEGQFLARLELELI